MRSYLNHEMALLPFIQKHASEIYDSFKDNKLDKNWWKEDYLEMMFRLWRHATVIVNIYLCDIELKLTTRHQLLNTKPVADRCILNYLWLPSKIEIRDKWVNLQADWL